MPEITTQFVKFVDFAAALRRKCRVMTSFPPSRRAFLRTAGLAGAAATLPSSGSSAAAKPNIVFVLADDLGHGDLGCYGQTKIRTPHIDRLAGEGMRFTQHYSGSPVCAPSRCVLLTGKHTGHAYIRDNDEMRERGDVWNDPKLEGQRPLPAGTVTVASVLKGAGYVTAGIGKWGLGGPGSSGEPNRQGFDFWYGYLCQRQAHNHYPDHLWRNGERQVMEGNPVFSPRQQLPEGKDPFDSASYEPYRGTQYSFDLMLDEAVRFLRSNRDRPFFLYLPFTIPHLALQVPDDSLREYADAFPETPYRGNKGYLPHPKPRAAYAAMVSRLDRGVGRITALLEELGIGNCTIVFFASDNGATFDVGGADTPFFESRGALRGHKGTVYEGGIRVPLIARWPGNIASGTVNSYVSAFWDLMPTFAELAGGAAPRQIDGISIVPTLLGSRRQRRHEYLYWEYARKMQAVRLGNWKAVRQSPREKIELYDLTNDPGEQKDSAAERPDIVRGVERILLRARTESKLFPLEM
jgi:arylsulfatase A